MLDPITIVQIGISLFAGSYFVQEEEEEEEETLEIEEDDIWG